MTTATIQQTIDDLRLTLTHYIEATYHISHPAIVAQRRELLGHMGGIFQAPYLESTPRYKSAEPYTKITDLPQAALDALRTLSDSSAGKAVIYSSPYLHQLEALQETLANGRNLMIMTGTGSGKTKSFLLPILGKLAIEAREHPQAFQKHHAVRALVLYPMNALVNDQLGRLRTLFGDPRTIAMFEKWAKRPALFARYTSRTPYGSALRTPGRKSARINRGFFRSDRRRQAPLRARPRERGGRTSGPAFCDATKARKVARQGERFRLARQAADAVGQAGCPARARRRASYAPRGACVATRPSHYELLDAGIHDDAAHRAAHLRRDARMA